MNDDPSGLRRIAHEEPAMPGTDETLGATQHRIARAFAALLSGLFFHEHGMQQVLGLE